ncbi:LPS export ABC transporter periplasmic protein LptC [Legionella sp. 16cNR16C]|uniref:LPS export ABC transporter periplasmic protein LptC n=1 Tax=Legionella sp. 16cNR16C TaxID=2905656 RepID=UPI001E5BC835|nr:LPS export ABC transporter periplasmic protein LptC [Legionella sp. 16cNR16C]MCE3044753.1 LPS export ABC transporter periplasmic protein LptC [Legionella sp. 16cNR16C]
MNAAKHAAWLFITLFALACSGWYFASSSSPTIKLDKQVLSIMPDAVVSGLVVRQFSKEGLLVNLLETPRLRHIPENNTHYLTAPHIIIKQNDQPGWEIRSAKAKSINGGQQINFTDEVVIHQDKSQHNEETTITTSELTYYPKTKFATTQALVNFVQPGSIVKSQGMNAYLADKRVQLSRVRATYEPRHEKS